MKDVQTEILEEEARRAYQEKTIDALRKAPTIENANWCEVARRFLLRLGITPETLLEPPDPLKRLRETLEAAISEVFGESTPKGETPLESTERASPGNSVSRVVIELPPGTVIRLEDGK